VPTQRDQPEIPPAPARPWNFRALPLVLLAVFFLAGLWVTKQVVLPQTRIRDLNRLSLYTSFSRHLLEADLARGIHPDVTLDKIRNLGLTNPEILPLDQAPSGSSPRYITPGSFVEAWEVFHGPDGQPAGIIRFHRWSDTTRWLLGILQALAGVLAIAGLLLIFTTWLSTRAPSIRRLRALTKEVREKFQLPAPPATPPREAMQDLEASIDEAAARTQSDAERRQRLLDGHEEAACLGTADGTLLEVNAAYARMFGRTREALTGTNYLDLIPPADRTEVVNGLQKLTPRHPTNNVTHRVVLPDGQIRWTRWRDRAVFDEQGAVQEILSFGLDVTGEQNLRDQVERLRLAFDQMQSLARTGSLTWNLSGDSMEWTDETFRLLGLERGETSPSLALLLDSVVPQDREPLRMLFERARENGDRFEREFRAVLPDGSVRVLQSRAEVRADPKTKILDRLTCTLRDITALRDAESATRRELRLREAIEQSLAAGIVASDDMGKNLLVNPAFCAMTGWSKEELVGLSAPYPYWPEEEIPNIRRAFEEALAGQTPPQGYELRFCRKDGTRFDVLVKVAPLLDSEDRRLGWLGAVTDISAIQQTRRELRAAEDSARRELLYRQAVDKSITVGLITIDLEGKPMATNEAYCRMFGYSEAEVLAMEPPYPLWPEDEKEKIEKAFALHLSGECPSEGFSLRFRHKDGHLVDVLITAAPVYDADGRQIGILSALTDITPLQEAQRRLRETNERLRIAQEVAAFGIWDWNPITDTLHWDRQSFAIFGHPEATDALEVWGKVHSEEEQERLTYELRRLIAAGGTTGEDRIRALWPDGTIHEILSTYIILRDESDKALRVLGVNRDVTSEVEEERELRDANERLAAALEGGNFGTFEHVIGFGDINWSPANYEINGIDPAITDPAELFAVWRRNAGDFFNRLTARMEAMPVDQKHLSYEFTARPAGQEPRRVRTSIFIERNKQGHPTRLVGITRRLD
jgi:PAS domain S-box-containing protein